MTDRHQEIAEKVVATFKRSLDANVRQQITEAQFTSLILMIKEAMGEELAFAAEQLEAVIRTLRSGAEKPDLGM